MKREGGRSGEYVAVTPKLGEEAEALDKAMNELRSVYELYFMGVERAEPVQLRDRVKGKLRWLQEQQIRNTALRFRINQLKARMISLENYWQRVLRQREAGTYYRDKAQLQKRQLEAKRIEQARAQAEAAAQPAPVPAGQAPKKRPRPRVRSAEDLTEPTLQRLYKTYATARQRCGEAVDLGYADMARTLRSQVPKILSSTGAKSVEFKVVIRNQHAVLKAVPRDD